jgi:hypothetical protein
MFLSSYKLKSICLPVCLSSNYMTLGLYFLEYDECLSLDLYSSVNVQVTKSLVGLIWFELPEQEDLVL